MKIIDWVLSTICLALGAALVWADRVADGLTLIGIALVVGALLSWLRAADRPTAEAIATDLRTKREPLELSKGLEPVPIPGENVGPSHRLGADPGCGICRSLRGGERG